MASIIPVGFGVAAFHFAVPNKIDDLVATCGYTYETGQDPSGHARTIREDFTAVGSPFAPGRMNVGTRFLGVSTTEMGPTGPVVGSDMTSVQGTQSSTTTPPINCAVLVKKNTGRGGRKGRGRMFLPCIMLDQTSVSTLGAITPAAVTSLELELNAALSLCVADEVPLQLLHADGSSGDGIISFSVASVIATQRRRLR